MRRRLRARMGRGHMDVVSLGTSRDSRRTCERMASKPRASERPRNLPVGGACDEHDRITSKAHARIPSPRPRTRRRKGQRAL